METLLELPDALGKLGLEYMRLPELIDIGISLSNHYLINLARRTLGEEFLNASGEELEDLMEQFSTPLTSAEFDGIAALLLLGQLPHLERDLFSAWLDLLDEQSPTFRRAMYPSILSYAQTLPQEEKESVWRNISATESLLPANQSQLDFLYDLAGPDIVQSMDSFSVLENNPQFFVRHLDQMPITSHHIIDVIETGDYEFIKASVKRYITQDNRNLVRKHYLAGYVRENYQVMLELLKDLYPDLYALVEKTSY